MGMPILVYGKSGNPIEYDSVMAYLERNEEPHEFE